MLGAKVRCPECGSENVFVGQFDGSDENCGECMTCGDFESAIYFYDYNPIYLDAPRVLADDVDHTYVDEDIRQHGIRFWREGYQDGRRGNLFANIEPLCSDSGGFEWGYSGTGPTTFALNIIETVLRREDCRGGRMGAHSGHLSPDWIGTCYRVAWRLRADFTDEFLVNAPLAGAEIGYAVVRGWVWEHIRRINCIFYGHQPRKMWLTSCTRMLG